MIGLFLGDTGFSDVVLNKIKKLKKKYFIIDFSKNLKFKKNKYSYRISIGKFGKILNLIKEKNGAEVSPSQIILKEDLNKVGLFKADINFHSDVKAQISIKIDKIQSK